MSDTPRTDELQKDFLVALDDFTRGREYADVTGSRMTVIFQKVRQLERELNAGQSKLSSVFQWINRNHPDGFIDSITHLQNLERVTDLHYEKLSNAEAELSVSNDERDHFRRENNELRQKPSQAARCLARIATPSRMKTRR